jgi:hypothetical protein
MHIDPPPLGKPDRYSPQQRSAMGSVENSGAGSGLIECRLIKQTS